jgi:phosphatidylglycerol lysyltransferase
LLLIDWAVRRRAALVAALTLVVLYLALFALSRLAAETDYDAITAALLVTPVWRIGLALVFVGISYAALSLYDANAFLALGAPQPWRASRPVQ